MGCASSSPTTPEERVPDLAIKTLMLAQRRKVRCTQATALAAASFLPLASPNDVLEWIKEPVLEASTDMPGVDMQRFDLDVPINVSTRSVSTVPTTLVLPSGTRVGVRVDPLVADAPTLSIVVPIAALQALGQPSVRIYAGEHDVAPIGHPSSSLSTASHGAMCPITPEELEDECPIILPMDVPERLRGGDNVCVVCKERLDACISDGTEQLVPLRQLPCAHAFHAACIDPWLTAHERTCPTCRTVVAPHAATGKAGSALNLVREPVALRAWENYLALRESGDLAAINRQHQLEREAEHRRSERHEREFAREWASRTSVQFVM